MNVGALGDAVVKGATKVAGAAAGVADTIGSKAGTVLKGGSDIFEGAVQKIDINATNAAQKHFTNASSKTVNRMGAAAGGGVYGAVLGAAGGGVVGGIAGGVDDDETVLGGALKGVAIGAGVGAIGGAAQGALRNESNIIHSATKDLAYAKKSLKGLGKDGVGLAEGFTNGAGI